jgi:hypothetical protein
MRDLRRPRRYRLLAKVPLTVSFPSVAYRLEFAPVSGCPQWSFNAESLAGSFDSSLYSAIANYLILRVNDQDARTLARNVAPSEIERRTADRLKTLPKYEALFFSEGHRQPVHLQLTK